MAEAEATRRIEDRLPRSLQNAVERIAQMSGWTARDVICAMLANGITQHATTTMDRHLLALMSEANLELVNDTLRRRAADRENE